VLYRTEEPDFCSFQCRVRPPASSSSGRVIHTDSEDGDAVTVAHPLQEVGELKTLNCWTIKTWKCLPSFFVVGWKKNMDLFFRWLQHRKISPIWEPFLLFENIQREWLTYSWSNH